MNPPEAPTPPPSPRNELDHTLDALGRQLAGHVAAAVVAALGRSPEPSSLLTLEEVARRLAVSPRTVENVIADGALTPLRVRNSRRFTPAMVEEYLRSCAGGARPSEA